jgi:hypothetical protein
MHIFAGPEASYRKFRYNSRMATEILSLRRHFIATALGAVTLLGAAEPGLAQLPGTRIPGGCDVPVSQRTSDTGCYLTATLALPELRNVAVYWHVYSYPSRAAADAAQKPPASIVVESLGTVWLFAIGDAGWQASSGQRVARIGPLPVTAVHRHAGPEAWYVVRGAQCLRTPDSTTVLRKGEGGFVAGGPPMMLTSLGPDTRRALALVLHESEQPWMTITTDWSPTVSCPES